MGLFNRLKKEIKFRYHVWKYVRVSRKWEIWPEFYSYRQEDVSEEKAKSFYSVWYIDPCTTVEGVPVESSFAYGRQATFEELLKNPLILSRKLIEFPFVRRTSADSWSMIKKFTILAVRDPSGTTVVLDGNHRILAALSSGSFPDVTMLVLEGKEFSKMSNKHPDLNVLK
jgi:hypothetical protein